mmetsp:Transcript_14860/g.31474  ORF Transcript_14860/g.31474 Transcript_14860/m.31474 type:complete len:136 (-) Transcript_14860:97-504(-)
MADTDEETSKALEDKYGSPRCVSDDLGATDLPNGSSIATHHHDFEAYHGDEDSDNSDCETSGREFVEDCLRTADAILDDYDEESGSGLADYSKTNNLTPNFDAKGKFTSYERRDIDREVPANGMFPPSSAFRMNT